MIKAINHTNHTFHTIHTNRSSIFDLRSSIFFRFTLFLVMMLLVLSVNSQSVYLPTGHHWHDFVRRMEIKSGTVAPDFHLLMKPLERKAVVDFLQHTDSTTRQLSWVDRASIRQVMQSNPEWIEGSDEGDGLWGRFYRNPAHLYQVENDDFFLTVNPVVHFEGSIEQDRELRPFQNTRGLEIRGMINKKVGFYSYLSDNQARFPIYVQNKIQQQRGAIPGVGWNIPFKNQGYDYFHARGYIAFQATRNIGLQFGQDKNFTGFGQRSLLLSDFSNNYLFLKINTNIWRLHYQNIFARLVDYPQRNYGGRIYDPKYMAAHTLSINITDRFQLGLFENVVFGRSDTVSVRGFDAHYLNPVIFYRAIEHHIGDPDKVSLGFTARYLAARRFAFHTQIYMDDFLMSDVRNDIDSLLVKLGLRKERKYTNYASFLNKFGIQLGMNHVDLFGIKNLDFNIEGTWVRPFTYTHYDTSGAGLAPAASYMHYGQPLAHPLGANFREYLFELQYQPHVNWLLKTVYITARQGMNREGVNMGSNIALDYTTRIGDYGHVFLQGDLRKSALMQAVASWQWMPGMWLDVNYLLRNETLRDTSNKSSVITLGLRINAVQRQQWY
jgi:hypothetical protein